MISTAAIYGSDIILLVQLQSVKIVIWKIKKTIFEDKIMSF